MSTSHRPLPMRLVLSVAVTILALATAHVRAATPFSLETVDETGNVGQLPALALDAQGVSHISYYDISNTALKYAVETGGIWSTETVDTGGVGLYSSLVIDADGNPHISYDDWVNGGLKYAVKTDGSWSVVTVESTGSLGGYGGSNSLALDAEGNPHISYYDYDNGDLRYAVKTGATWSIEAADTTGDVGRSTSLALDAQGNPHIGYGDRTNDNLKYAVKTGGVWSVETADMTGSVNVDVSLALDAQGNPHIGYDDYIAGDLKYVVKTGGSWSTEIADAPGSVGGNPSLALDVQGNPHISYYDRTNDDLKYAVKTGGFWSTQTVDAPGDGGKSTSLVLDAQGNPHIAYYDVTNGDLEYADASIHLRSPVGGEAWSSAGQDTVTWDGLGMIDIEASADGGANYTTLARNVVGGSAIVSVPAWDTRTARVRITRADPFATSESPAVFTIALQKVAAWWQTVADPATGQFTSLALDAQGNPHVSYSGSDLKYAVKTGGSWNPESVDATAAVVGQYNSIGLDSQGNPHISYRDEINDVLKYAAKMGGSWSIETVAAMGTVGSSTSLALDAEGNSHISYYDNTNDDLMYAFKTGGAWSIETVDATGGVGQHSSLALDAHGNPHVSYYDFTNSALKYAVKTSGTWSTETVGGVAIFTSLALDASGNPYIAYHDFTTGDLELAVKTDGIWTIETVDAAGIVGQHASLRLDARGNPHVTYYDGTNSDLKYAVKTGGGWRTQTVDAAGDVGQYTSLALDAQGNPHVSYYDATDFDLEYTSAAIEVAAPAGGDVWPVGAVRTVTWDGLGTVDVSLSIDGGYSYAVLARNVNGGSYDLLVPHTPSRFSRIRIERRVEANTFGAWCYPLSIANSDSLFTIETTVELLALKVAPATDNAGLVVSWQTDPGPQDLAGYRLEKLGAGRTWHTLVSKTRATEYHDTGGTATDRYRLFAINGVGDEFHLGETRVEGLPSLSGRLVAYPVPFRDGDLTIRFAPHRVNGVPLQTSVAIYDATGRRVRALASGRFPGAVARVAWDGRDDRGTRVANGVYFVRVQDPLDRSTKRITVVR